MENEKAAVVVAVAVKEEEEGEGEGVEARAGLMHSRRKDLKTCEMEKAGLTEEWSEALMKERGPQQWLEQVEKDVSRKMKMQKKQHMTKRKKNKERTKEK